ncbi:hypothetical protein [Oceanobacillus rekensis]|nr:hypothetical protein [Oceanobacillus rekensis]
MNWLLMLVRIIFDYDIFFLEFTKTDEMMKQIKNEVDIKTAWNKNMSKPF